MFRHHLFSSIDFNHHQSATSRLVVKSSQSESKSKSKSSRHKSKSKSKSKSSPLKSKSKSLTFESKSKSGIQCPNQCFCNFKKFSIVILI